MDITKRGDTAPTPIITIAHTTANPNPLTL